MKNKPLQICNMTIHPGETLSLALPLPELFSCAPLYMPVKVIHGKKPGPCVLVTSAMRGDELNGTEIIRRLLEVSAMKQLHGTLIAIPVFNVYGLMNRSQYLPGQIDLDRCFPGSKTGTHAARMAHLFMEEIFSKADIAIDLRTGFINYSNLPMIDVDPQNETARTLSLAFNAPVICKADSEKGRLMTLAIKQGKPFLTYKAGEAMRFDEHAIKVGVKGILNVMRKLAMLPEKITRKAPVFKSFFAEKNIWLRASTSGLSYTRHKLGQYVQKGEQLCVIRDPFGSTDSVMMTSPYEAIIVGKNNLPLVHEGEGLLQLAVFRKMEHAATHLEDWKERSKKSFQEPHTE